MADYHAIYCTGYSIGVGGIVIYDNKVLLVRRAMNPRAGDWALPGGYVEADETVHIAVQREVLEETGIQAEVVGLTAVIHRWVIDENGIYLMFLMRTKDKHPQPDGVEVDDARFFTLEQLQDLPRLQWLSRIIVTPILEGQATTLPHYLFPGKTTLDDAVLYAGENIRPGHEVLMEGKS